MKKTKNRRKRNSKQLTIKNLSQLEKRPITLTGKYSSGMSYIFDAIFELITRKP